MCSDDMLCPGALQTVNDVFIADRFGGAMWVYGKTISADLMGRAQGIDGEPPNWSHMRNANCIGQPSVFWNRAMMDLAGMFDLRYKHAADYDLWLRFWKQRDPAYINHTLGIFCHHENQNTSVNSRATEAEARNIAWRHSVFGDVIARARAIWMNKQIYGGQEMPRSSDDIG
jgi:hypothetical protein